MGDCSVPPPTPPVPPTPPPNTDSCDLTKCQCDGVDLAGLRVDGGVSLSNELLQCQADLLSVAVERPANVETTASGAAIAAGIGAGVWSSPDELAGGDDVERSFAPAIDDAERAQRCAKWDQAVQCSLNWA